MPRLRGRAGARFSPGARGAPGTVAVRILLLKAARAGPAVTAPAGLQVAVTLHQQPHELRVLKVHSAFHPRLLQPRQPTGLELKPAFDAHQWPINNPATNRHQGTAQRRPFVTTQTAPSSTD